MVRAFETLHALDTILQFKLQFGHGWIELDVGPINFVGREAEVRPSKQHLVATVLQAVLPSFKEVGQLVLNFSRITAIAYQLNVTLGNKFKD